jgi:fibronectin-binding autotransporter adhesin
MRRQLCLASGVVVFTAMLLLSAAPHPAYAVCTQVVVPGITTVTCSGQTGGTTAATGTDTVDFTFDSTFEALGGATPFAANANPNSGGAATAIFDPGASVAAGAANVVSFRSNARTVAVNLPSGASFGSFQLSGQTTANITINGTSDQILANLSLPASSITVGGEVIGTTVNPDLNLRGAIVYGAGTVDLLPGSLVVSNSSSPAIRAFSANQSRLINAGSVIGSVTGLNYVELRPTGSFSSTVDAASGSFVAPSTFALGGPGTGSFNLSQVGPSSKYRGFDAFLKTGTSTWSVTGAPLSNLPWTIEDGTLIVAAGASLGSGDVTVEGGTLKGFGTVGDLFNVGGTVRPGGSIGTLHVAGDFTAGPGGTTAIELNPQQSSMLDVTGDAFLGGKFLAVPDAGSYAPGLTLTFLTTGGTRFDTFDTVQSALPALLFDVIYGANFASLTFLGYDFSQFAETPNQKSVAKAIDKGSGNEDFNALLYELAALPPQDILGGLSQLGSEVATVFPNVTQEDRRALMASFVDRLGPSCLEKGKRFGADPMALAPTIWARGFYREDDISQTGGATVGLETHPDRHTCAGLGFNYADTDLSLDGLPQSGEVQAYSLGAYARRDWPLLFVDGAAAATYADVDSTRHILFAGETARGDTEATGAGAIVGVGAVLRSGAFVLEPRIGLDYDHNTQDAFRERDSAAALRVGSDERDALRSNLGARAHAIWNFASGAAIMPEISAAWAHDLLDPAVAIRQSFLAAQNASFLIRGEDPPADSFLLGAGLSFHPNASDELFIRYDGAWAKDDIHGSAISAGGKIHW